MASDDTTLSAQVNRLNVNEEEVRLPPSVFDLLSTATRKKKKQHAVSRLSETKIRKLTLSKQPSGTAPSELVTVVDDLLAQLQTKFSNVSAELVGKCIAPPSPSPPLYHHLLNPFLLAFPLGWKGVLQQSCQDLNTDPIGEIYSGRNVSSVR